MAETRRTHTPTYTSTPLSHNQFTVSDTEPGERRRHRVVHNRESVQTRTTKLNDNLVRTGRVPPTHRAGPTVTSFSGRGEGTIRKEDNIAPTIPMPHGVHEPRKIATGGMQLIRAAAATTMWVGLTLDNALPARNERARIVFKLRATRARGRTRARPDAQRTGAPRGRQAIGHWRCTHRRASASPYQQGEQTPTRSACVPTRRHRKRNNIMQTTSAV